MSRQANHRPLPSKANMEKGVRNPFRNPSHFPVLRKGFSKPFSIARSEWDIIRVVVRPLLERRLVVFLHLPLVENLVISVLVQPDRIGVLADEFLLAHTVDGRRAADADLLAIHENSHEILLALLLCGTLGGG